MTVLTMTNAKEGQTMTKIAHSEFDTRSQNLAACFAAIEDEKGHWRRQNLGPCVGLSAKRWRNPRGFGWEVTFGVHHDMTIICSEEIWSDRATNDIAATLLGCWDAEWDET